MLGGGRGRDLRVLERQPAAGDRQRRVHDRVAGDQHVGRVDVLVEQVRRGQRRRRQVQRGDLARPAARLASSGNGESRSPERSPASRCTTGMRRQNAASAPARLVVVSPCTITAAGVRSANSSSSCRIISVSSSGWLPVTRSSGRRTSGFRPNAVERLGHHRRVLAAGDQYRA